MLSSYSRAIVVWRHLCVGMSSLSCVHPVSGGVGMCACAEISTSACHFLWRVKHSKHVCLHVLLRMATLTLRNGLSVKRYVSYIRIPEQCPYPIHSGAYKKLGHAFWSFCELYSCTMLIILAVDCNQSINTGQKEMHVWRWSMVLKL